MNRFFRYVTLAAIAISAIACDALSEMNDRIDSLESRIKAIESIIPSLNNNIEALKALASGGTVSEVVLVDGRYKMTLGNGEIVYLTQGSHGSAPTMSVDAQGYWMADYHDGYGPVYVLSNGNKVSAVGVNGVTPQFGVDKEGFWIVSYDNGNTWAQVCDADGKPVTALPEGDSNLFSEINVTESEVAVSLVDGRKFTLPLVPDFQFVINAPTDIIPFEEGEAKTYVIVSKGVESASIIAVPNGFKAILSEDVIIIQALIDSKAYADSATDVVVLALSKDGHAAIGKVRVSKK